MLQISHKQMIEFKRHRLLMVKQEIVNTLFLNFPEQFELGEKSIEAFVTRSMEAARAIYIDDADQIKRFVCAIFVLEFILKDSVKLKYFARVMISEETVEARLLFVEKNILRSDRDSAVRSAG